MEIFTLKRGDTSPALKYELGVSGLNLAGASVSFQMRRRRGVRVIDAPAAVLSTSPSVILAYYWQDGDSDALGSYEAEFRVVYADETSETFPNRGFIPVLIGEDA